MILYQNSHITWKPFQQNSEDSGIVSFRDEEHLGLTDHLTLNSNLDTTAEEEPVQSTEELKLDVEPSPRFVGSPQPLSLGVVHILRNQRGGGFQMITLV